MTEYENTPSTLHDPRLDRLDAAMSEPTFAKASAMARTFNDLLSEQDVSHDEANEIVSELDREWGPLHDMPVRITGRVKIYVGNGKPEYLHVEDEPFISKGFCSVVRDEETKDGTKVAYYFYYPASEEVRRKTGMTHTGCYADIDDVAIDMTTPSSERAAAWLGVFEPELIENIDLRVLNANGNEASALYALKDLRFSLPKEEIDFANVCLNRYISDIIQFDDQIPYGLKVDGMLFLHKNDDEFIPARLKGGRMLAKIESVMSVSYDTDYGLAVRLTSMPGDRSVRGHSILMPLSSITSIVSLRDAYYAD